MEQRGRKQKVRRTGLWFRYIVTNGVSQSFVVHIILFLVLALSVTHIDKPKFIKLNISFEPVEELSIEPVEIPRLPEPQKIEIADSDPYIAEFESINIDNYISEDNNLEPSLIEEVQAAEVSQPIQTLTDAGPKKVNPTSLSVDNKTTKSSYGDKFQGMMKAKIGGRLEKYGAQTGDVQISIAWDDYNDIDLFVVFEGIHSLESCIIGWPSKIGLYGGMLDIDMNVHPFSNEAVENIFWPSGQAPYGKYMVYIHHYHQWDTRQSTPVYVRIQIDDQIIYKKAVAKRGSQWTRIHTFVRKPAKN